LPDYLLRSLFLSTRLLTLHFVNNFLPYT